MNTLCRTAHPVSSAYVPAERAALRVVPASERDEWRDVLATTRGTWWRAYELRDIEHPVRLV